MSNGIKTEHFFKSRKTAVSTENILLFAYKNKISNEKENLRIENITRQFITTVCLTTLILNETENPSPR